MTNYVLVHGGFVGGWYWDQVAESLRSHGHRVEVIEQLPSSGSDPAALGDLSADARRVREVVAGVAEPVVLVGHSYGGMVITELADDPAVAHAVYLSAFWPERGQSLNDFLGGHLPDWIVPHADGTVTVTEDVDVAREALCADIDATTTAANMRRFVPQSISSLAAASSAPDRTHPATYIICELDNAIPPAAQEAMSARADRVERLASSHQAMGSMPERVASLLEGVA